MSKVLKIILFIFFLSMFFVIYCATQENQNANNCLSCHNQQISLTQRFPHPFIKEERCTACHTSYDESMHKEIIKPTLDICITCHSQEKLGRSHPVGEGIRDPNTESTMTCVSSCHLMHSSDYRYQTPFKNNMDLCLSCHKEF